MGNQHNISTARTIKRGSASKAKDTTGGKEAGSLGIVMSHVLYYSFGTPILGDADGVCASQSITTPANGVINGALATGGVATFDHPRNVVAAWTGTAVLTITGTDVYGATVVESSASGTTFTGLKAFKTITKVAVSANVTACTVGTGDVLGLPYACGVGDVLVKMGGSALDTGTFVVADTTNPATATTGDVRGTFDPSTALNGSTEIQVLLHISASDKAAYGVNQYAG